LKKRATETCSIVDFDWRGRVMSERAGKSTLLTGDAREVSFSRRPDTQVSTALG